MSLHLPKLGADPRSPFPDPAEALHRPNGLLAFGGDLAHERLVAAYAAGIFPWYSDGQPILWWSPDPRIVFETAALHLPTRLRRSLRDAGWRVRADTRFDDGLAACAHAPRPGQDGTWISAEMREAYGRLHLLGHAHSIEVEDRDGALVGGLYGVAVGRMFFGESMFSAASGGSKVALAALAHRLRQWDWPWIDAQVENAHLRRLGAVEVARPLFLSRITTLTSIPERPGAWSKRFGVLGIADLGPHAVGRGPSGRSPVAPAVGDRA